MAARNRIASLEKNMPKPAAKSILQKVLDGGAIYDDDKSEYEVALGRLSFAENLKFAKQLLEIYFDDTSDSHKRLADFIRSEDHGN